MSDLVLVLTIVLDIPIIPSEADLSKLMELTELKSLDLNDTLY